MLQLRIRSQADGANPSRKCDLSSVDAIAIPEAAISCVSVKWKIGRVRTGISKLGLYFAYIVCFSRSQGDRARIPSSNSN